MIGFLILIAAAVLIIHQLGRPPYHAPDGGVPFGVGVALVVVALLEWIT